MFTTGAALVILTLAVGSLVWSKDKEENAAQEQAAEQRQKVDMAALATVTIDQAIKTALKTLSGTVVDAELEKQRDATVWEVSIMTANKQLTAMHIDAASGAVIETDTKNIEKAAEKL